MSESGSRDSKLLPFDRPERAWTGGAKVDGDLVPAITSVDMTPRRRYRETQEAFERRMGRMGYDLAQLRREMNLDNRAAALRSVEATEHSPALYFTQCACGWCGLRVTDPEVARREYDAHACAVDDVGQRATDRAIAETDRGVLEKRESALVKRPAFAEADPFVIAAERQVVVADEFEQRVALLEPK